MDKQTIIDLSNQFYNNQIPLNAVQIVLNYCVERGKNPNLSNTFIQMSLQLGFFNSLYQQVLEYYQRQFEVCLVKNDLGKIIKAI
jgi:translation initiation factor 2 beta subunit (eIF-2beta)/eIF-5